MIANISSSSGQKFAAIKQQNSQEPQSNPGQKDFGSLFKQTDLAATRPDVSAREGVLAKLITLQSGERFFKLEPVIGDDAISFEALPMIGPTKIGDLAAQELQEPVSPISAATGTISNTVPLNGQTHQAAPKVGLQEPSAVPMSTFPSDGTVGPIRFNSLHYSNVKTENYLASPKKEIVAQGAKASPIGRSSGPDLVSQPLYQSATTNARSASLAAFVAALPEEIRVTLRGLNLSEAERELLTADIRDALAQHGLSNRNIHIISGQGTV